MWLGRGFTFRSASHSQLGSLSGARLSRQTVNSICPIISSWQMSSTSFAHRRIPSSQHLDVIPVFSVHRRPCKSSDHSPRTLVELSKLSRRDRGYEPSDEPSGFSLAYAFSRHSPSAPHSDSHVRSSRTALPCHWTRLECTGHLEPGRWRCPLDESDPRAASRVRIKLGKLVAHDNSLALRIFDRIGSSSLRVRAVPRGAARAVTRVSATLITVAVPPYRRYRGAVASPSAVAGRGSVSSLSGTSHGESIRPNTVRCNTTGTRALRCDSHQHATLLYYCRATRARRTDTSTRDQHQHDAITQLTVHPAPRTASVPHLARHAGRALGFTVRP